MTMPDHLIGHILSEARKGNARMTTRGRNVTIRFGLPASAVVRHYTEADEWLVVRKVAVYPGGRVSFNFRATAGRWGRKDGKHQRLNAARPSKVGSRKRLEKVIRSMMQGSTAGADDQYIEVLVWREDGDYPAPSKPEAGQPVRTSPL